MQSPTQKSWKVFIHIRVNKGSPLSEAACLFPAAQTRVNHYLKPYFISTHLEQTHKQTNKPKNIWSKNVRAFWRIVKHFRIILGNKGNK